MRRLKLWAILIISGVALAIISQITFFITDISYRIYYILMKTSLGLYLFGFGMLCIDKREKN